MRNTAKSDDILRTYYHLTALFTLSASLIWGVNTLFLLEAGLSLLEVFLVNAVFSAGLAFFEVPTGIVADVLGRRKSVLICALIMMLGSLAYAVIGVLHGGFWAFAAASVFMALGFTFFSGAIDAWVVDALRETGNPHPLDFVFASAAIYSSAAMLAGTVIGGLLGTIHLSLPYFVRAVLLISVLVVASRHMWDLGFECKKVGLREYPQEMRKIASAIVFFGWKESQMRFLILAGAFQAVVIAWSYHAWQPYLLGFLKDPQPWVAGLIAAAISLSMMAGNIVVARTEKFCGKRTTFLLFASAVFSLAMVGVGSAGSFWSASGYYLIAMGALGVFGPVRSAYIHAVTPTEFRATISSFDSLVSSAVSAGGQGGLGWMVRLRSLDFGYMAGGLFSLWTLPALLLLRSLGGKRDIFSESCLDLKAKSRHPSL